MSRIAVIGERDSIYGFALVGLEIFPVDTPAEAGRLLRNLADNGYAVVYVTEALYVNMPAEIALFRSRALPAVIAIPGATGNTGAGMDGVRKSVIQAVGSDIVFGDYRD